MRTELGIKIALEIFINIHSTIQKIIMKTKLNIALCALLFSALVSCSTGRYASAQYSADENTYSNSDQGSYSDSPNDYDNYNNNNYNDYYDNGSSGASIDVFVDQLSPYG